MIILSEAAVLIADCRQDRHLESLTSTCPRLSVLSCTNQSLNCVVNSVAMKHWNRLLIAVVAFAFSGTAVAQIGVAPKKDTTLQDATDAKFKPGDVWEYTTREGEERSTLTILKVDNSPELGVIVHIGVEKIKLANCRGGPSPESVPHMPFARKALDDSVTKKIASNRPLPNFREGYEEWKEAYSKKKAGIYIVGVSSAVGVAEKTYRSGIGCE